MPDTDPELAEVPEMQQDTREEIARLRKNIDDTQRTLEIVEAAALDLRAELTKTARRPPGDRARALAALDAMAADVRCPS